MALTNAGCEIIAALITGKSNALFNNANARIGVGDSNKAFSADQTDLQATTNKVRKGMDPGYPQVNGNTITFRATFGPSDANFAWQEWGIFNAESGGAMLNRVVEYNGTKVAGQTWVFQVTLTISAG